MPAVPGLPTDPAMADADPPPLTTAPAPGGALAPFRYPAFKAIWIANLASSLGATIQSVGAAWLMTDLSHSHQMVALVQASTTIPILLFGVFAGAIADNFDRRRIMLAAQIGMLCVSAVLFLVTWRGVVTPWLLLALTVIIGTGTALNSPAWQASVRQQVGRADLPQAISLNTIAFNLARSVGPALGGLLISLWSVALAFGFNALSYIGMIVVLWRWRPETPPPVRQQMLGSIAAGIRYCAGAPAIRKVLLRGLTLGFGVAGYQALVPAIVRDQLGGDEIDLGLMLGAFGIGSIIAALFVTKLRRRFGSEHVVAGATVCFIVAQFVLAEATTLAQALPATFITGAGWVSALTSLNVAMQMRSPEAILGRCLSIYQAITFGGMAVGSWIWGLAADWRGLPFALHGAGAFLAVSLVILRIVAPMPKPGEGRVD